MTEIIKTNDGNPNFNMLTSLWDPVRRPSKFLILSVDMLMFILKIWNELFTFVKSEILLLSFREWHIPSSSDSWFHLRF